MLADPVPMQLWFKRAIQKRQAALHSVINTRVSIVKLFVRMFYFCRRKSFGQNPRRPRTNGLPTTAERMEDRSLLSVAALFVGGELFISSDGGDDITVRQNTSGRVEVLANGSILGTAPNVATSSVTSPSANRSAVSIPARPV